MIIKKKYTNIKKIEIEPAPEFIEPQADFQGTDGEQESLDADVTENGSPEQSDENTPDDTSVEETVQNTVQEEPSNMTFDDLDLSFENIKFDQREERREGTRRRGYRRTQDRNIVTRAQQDAISIKEVAKSEGYQEGLKNAENDINTLKSNLAEFFMYKEQVYDKLSYCILDISVEIAKKILNKEIEKDNETVIPIIKKVLEDVNKSENKITLKVMTKDVEIVKDKISDIFEGNSFEAKISVIPDNSITEGGVIVETTNGLIDATIKTQLAIIEKALKGKNSDDENEQISEVQENSDVQEES